MKGMMNLLERAGLVRRVEDDPTAEGPGGAVDVAVPEPAAAAPAAPAAVAAADTVALPSGSESPGVNLERIYESAGVPPCPYPAERLLRLLDGLKAMDEGLRLQTIRAIDAADDSWSIDDPQRDAAAKVAALEHHAAAIRASLARAEQQAQAQLGELAQRQEASVADIRRQISDLEGLLAREVARIAQEQAALEAALRAQREGAQRELDTLSRTAGAFAGLLGQFGGKATV